MTRLRARRSGQKEEQELNITAFMNLMVVLVPILLMSAVFSRLAILQLNLPEAGAAAKEQKQPPFTLEIVIHKDVIDVGDTRGGLIQKIPMVAGKYDYAALSKLLQQVKARYPENTSATILSEQETAYDTLVQVMDSVRMFKAVQNGKVIHAELFPDISIGDAAN